MWKLAVLGLLGAFAAFAWLSLPKPANDPAAPRNGEPAQGVVVVVDGSARSLTISHGPLRSTGMGPMTMVFSVRDPALLAGIKAGDRIRFTVEAAGGELTATDIVLMN